MIIDYDKPICKFCGLNPPGCGQCSWSGHSDDTQTAIPKKQSMLKKMVGYLK